MIRYFFFLFFLVTLVSPLRAQESDKPRVAIIGGGMAGISAAHFLVKNHTDVSITIFEKEAVPGGNAQTRRVANAFGDSVNVDIGPQYFADEAWGTYIEVLDEYGLMSPYDLLELKGTIVMRRPGEEKPVFISPKGWSFRGEKIKNLKQFYRFQKSAHRLYATPYDSIITVEAWLQQVDVTDEFRNTTLYPFMASAMGTSIAEIKQLSAQHIVKLFAFRGPLEKNMFYVLHNGMGNTIRTMGDTLVARGVELRCSEPVVSVRKSGGAYQLRTESGTYDFDFVIFAVHPDHAAAILEGSSYGQLTETLRKFQYFKAQIVLHRDSTFGYAAKPSFLNISTNASNEVLSNTMDLGCIDKAYTGLYKSWLKDADLERVKANGTFVDVQVFDHPLISPEFVTALHALHNQVSRIDNLYFSGGWSEGLETQETAILSGERAAEKCRVYFEGR